MAILDFGHKMAKKQNFQNRYNKFVECHTGKVNSKFQVPSMKVLFFGQLMAKKWRPYLILIKKWPKSKGKVQSKFQVENSICGFLLFVSYIDWK